MPPRKTPPGSPPAGNDEPSKANIDHCRRCELWEHATQGVAGEGPRDARILLVGEQPGDEEDVQGRPFVGPAGRLLPVCEKSERYNVPPVLPAEKKSACPSPFTSPTKIVLTLRERLLLLSTG